MDPSITGPGPCQPPDCCPASTGNPINYFNGRILLTEDDIEAGIPGFGHSRMFLNKTYHLDPWDSAQGWNWAVEEWPYLVRRVHEYLPGEMVENIVLKRGLIPLWFNKLEDGTFVARYGADSRNTLKHVPADGIYRYTSLSEGRVEVIEFQDFDQAPTVAGMLKRKIDEKGFETLVVTYGDKCVEVLETTRGDTTFRMRYDYFSGGSWDGKISSVTLEAEVASVISYLRRTRYLYYAGDTAEGDLGDLKAAITQQPVADSDPLEWEDVSARYYRYTKDSRHLLTTIVGPTVYMKLKEFGQDVLTMPASSRGPDLVPQFANHVFTYDKVNRVINEVARGSAQSTGPEGLTYVRERNPNVARNQHTPATAADYNTWIWKVTETGFEGYRQIVYTNKIGQIMVTVKQSLDDPARQWIDAVRRDENASAILTADPSAVARIDEALPDLIGYREADGSYAHLREHEGLITRSEYYTSTTATSATPGGVKGYSKSSFVQRGWAGDLIPQREVAYVSSDNTSGPVTYAVASETAFREDVDTPSSRATTTHAYTWYAPSGDLPPRIAEKLTTFPAVPASEGGAIPPILKNGFLTRPETIRGKWTERVSLPNGYFISHEVRCGLNLLIPILRRMVGLYCPATILLMVRIIFMTRLGGKGLS